MIEVTEARDLVGAMVQSTKATRVHLADACGRWLREEVAAKEDMPAFDRSAMDGYAIRADDRSERFRVIGESQAGGAIPPAVSPGECVRIFTGAVLPAGATQVLIQEEVKRDGDWIVPVRRPDSLHIRRRGEDARRGDVLLPTGVQLGPGACALLASIGLVSPLVSEKVRVMHVTTGDELIDPARAPAVGQIRDSNSTLVAALLRQAGADLAAHEHSKDSLDALLALVQSRAAGECEMLLVSGGASVGAYDFGARALTESGYQIHFDRINLRPGKPTIFASRGAQIAFVIPGNPLAHFVVFHLLVWPALRMFAGAPMRWPMARLKTSGPVELTSDRRETFWPGRLRFDSGGLSVEPLRWQSSGDMSSLPFVDALIRIPAGTAISRDGSVETLLLDSFHGNSDAREDE